MADEFPGDTGEKEKRNFSKANLKGKDFRNRDLAGADFRKAKLAGADLSGADLSGADLSGANLSGTILVNVKAEGTNFSGAVLSKTVVTGMKAKNADFTKAGFRNVDLDGISDEGSRFLQASFSRCRIKNSHFSGTRFDESNFFRSRFTDCRLEDCSFSSVKAPATRVEKTAAVGCAFSSSDLLSLFTADSTFEKCNFGASDMAGMLSAGCTFDQCDFSGAEVTASEFKNSTFARCCFEKADFRYVVGLPEETLAEVKAAGGRVSRYLLRRLLRWGFSTKQGAVIFLVVLVVSLLAVSGYLKNPGNWSKEKLWNRANLAQNEGRTEDAVRYFEALVARLPEGGDQFPEAKLELARVYLRMNKNDQAKKIAREILEDELVLPSIRVSALTILARVDILKEEFDGIGEKMDKILQGPGNDEIILDAFVQVINQLVSERHFSLVQSLIDSGLKKFSENDQARSRLFFLRSQALLNSDFLDQAIADLQELESRSLSPDMEQSVLMGLGDAYRRKGDMERSREYYRVLAEKFPDARERAFQARLEEASTLRSMGNYEEAKSLLEQLAGDTDNQYLKGRAKNDLATTLLDQGQVEKAKELFQKTLRSTDVDPGIRFNAAIHMVRILKDQGEPKEALELVTELVERNVDPNQVQMARNARMELYILLGELDKAIADAEFLVKTSTDAGQKDRNLFSLARLYEGTGKEEKALKLFEGLSDPAKPLDTVLMAFQQRMEILKRLGRKEEALKLAEQMEQSADSLTQKLVARVHRVETHASWGEQERTLELLREIRKMEVPRRLPPGVLHLMDLGMNDAFRHDVIKVFEHFDEQLTREGEPVRHWMLRLSLGHIRAQENDFDRAKELFEGTFDGDASESTRLQAGEALGRLLTEHGKPKEALEVFAKIERLWPDHLQAKVVGHI